jgi:hypothetical protein
MATAGVPMPIEVCRPDVLPWHKEVFRRNATEGLMSLGFSREGAAINVSLFGIFCVVRLISPS